jgi:hypothetical protein
VERPGFVIAGLVRSRMIRVPARYRPWLADELATGKARRRTAIAGLAPGGLGFSVAWTVVGTLEGAPWPVWFFFVALAPTFLLGLLGFGYGRTAAILTKRNHLDVGPSAAR